MQTLSVICACVLLFIAALHGLWGIGIWWPAANEQSLARSVVGAPGITQMPSLSACLFVAIALSIAAFVTIVLGQGWEFSIAPKWAIATVGAGIVFVFVGRGIVGYLPFWAKLTPEMPFRSYDFWYYSPFCLILGGAVATLVLDYIHNS